MSIPLSPGPLPDRPRKVLFTCNRTHFDARELLRGITSDQGTHQWILRVCGEPQSRAQWRQWLDEFKPDGILVFSPINAAIHAELRRDDRPHIFLTWGIDPVGEKNHVFLPDERAVGLFAAHHFLERKFQHFAVVSYEVIAHMVSRKEGFEEALAEAGHLPHTYTENFERNPLKPYGENIPRSLYSWLERLPHPCGLLAGDDEIGVVVIEACRHLNIAVPRDIAVLGAGDDGQTCRIIAPRMSSVRVPFTDIGREAAAALDRMMKGQAEPSGLRLFPPLEVVVRASTEALGSHDPVVAQALAYISLNYHRILHVTDLLQHTGVSAKTLENRFKSELRRTPIEEIRRYRIEQAKRLLVETDLAVAQIAEQCGFRHAHKFSTVFKEMTHQRPLEYRKLHGTA